MKSPNLTFPLRSRPDFQAKRFSNFCSNQPSEIKGAASKLGASRKRRIALYSPGMVGLGHMRRNLLIAQALARSNPGAAILLISEAREASNFALPPGVDCLTLPALYKRNDGQLQSRYLDLPVSELVKIRMDVIHSALLSFNPDLLIVDHLPCGAYQELLWSLEGLKAMNDETHFVLGIRDVLEDPAIAQREWLNVQNRTAINEFYDAIWIYGDPRVFDPVSEYCFPRPIAKKVTFTGYLDQRPRLQYINFRPREYIAQLGLPTEKIVLCVVGGGSDGAHLAAAFAESELPSGYTGIIVSGPYMPPKSRRELVNYSRKKSSIRVLEFVNEPTALIHCADRVIAMGGYNTICEILSFHKTALVVPRSEDRKEQAIRAERLANLGHFDFLHPGEVTAQKLSRWISLPENHRDALPLDFRGLDRVTEMVDEMLHRCQKGLLTRKSAGSLS